MAVSVSNEYKQIIYSGDARNKLKLLFNNVELEEADRYCEKMTIKSRIVPNGAKIFSLNNFISKEVELILHDIDTSIIQDQVSISIGTLVGNNYEYVPIGIFNIQNQPTNDKNKTTIKLRDNSVKFDFNYNAQPLIEENGGSATKLQILQDICTQAGVTCNITSFIGYLDEIGIYDNTVTARKYIADIAEQAGKIATINRSGELIFVDLNNLTTWEIPIEVVEKYESGTKFKVGKVVYEDGIVRYETEDSNDDTLFLDGSNDYINGEKVVEQASSSNNFYSLQDTGEAKLKYFQMEGKTTQETTTPNKNLLYINSVSSGSGVTITRYSNSEIVITGTSTSSGTITIPLNSQQLSNQPYTVSAIVTGTINKEIYVDLNTTYNLNLEIDESGTFTQTSTTETTSNIVTEMVLTFNNSTTFNNVHIKLQLEQSSTATSYIESQLPMPSPDYPSELNSVGYENLTQLNNYTNNVSGVYFIDRKLLDNFENNTTYTLSFDITSTIEPFIVSIGYGEGSFQADGPYVSNQYNGHISLTFTTNNSTYSNLWIRIPRYTTPTTYQTEVKNMILVKGSEEMLFIPYGKYGVEVKTTGKNLLGLKDKSQFTSYGVNITVENEEITINGTTNNSGGMVITDLKTPLEIINGINYTLSAIVEGTVDKAFNIQLRDASSNIITKYNNTLPYTFNDASGTAITLRFYVSANTIFNNYKIKLQLEKGTQATEYEAYKENIYLYTLDNPLRSIGDTKDLLYIRNDMLYVERKIGSVVLDGSESGWNTFKDSSNHYNYWIHREDISKTVISCLSDYFKYRASGNNFIGEFQIGGYNPNKNGNIVINPFDDTTNNLTQFKTWLSTHNTEVQYVLATPYIEELGTIEVPNTYEEITYIDISSNIDTNTYLQYREDKTQVEAILNEVDEFDIDSLKTGKILGNPAIDSYDLIQIHDKSKNLFDGEFRQGSELYIGNLQNLFSKNDLILPSGTYTFSCNLPLNDYKYAIGTSQTSFPHSATWIEGFHTTSKFTFTINQEAYIGILINGNGSNITVDDVANYYFQIEVGNVATDYVPFKDETYTTLATNDLVYTGVLINTFDTQIGEEAKEQNVFVNGEETFKKWARTKIDNVEGTLTLQAGEINEVNGKLNSTTLQINSQGALLDVLANKSNIDVEYDSEGNPLNGEVREVTTTTGFKFNAEGMTIEDSNSNFKALHRNDGTYYKEGDNVVGQYTKDGSKQKDLELFGVYYYGKNNWPDTPMFVAQLYTDGNGEEAFGHFYNRGD